MQLLRSAEREVNQPLVFRFEFHPQLVVRTRLRILGEFCYTLLVSDKF
jgi:hypothetical protein